MDIKDQITEVLKSYPTMQYSSERNELSGELFISDYDSYQIRIDLGAYPRFFPYVYEMEERIPVKADRHIYTDSERCCLTTRAKENILLKNKIKTLYQFISFIVIPFFQNNSYYEIEKKYKQGEYSHGVPGIIEAYKEILHLDNLNTVPKAMEILRLKNIKKNDPCFCNSGLKLKQCSNGRHFEGYKEFKLIDLEIIEDDLYKWINPFIREMLIYNRFEEG